MPEAMPEEAPLGRRERRKLEVRARIYGAARELFAKQGFDATTVDEIAAAADVASATFFNHFQSKQVLLGLMATEVVDALQSLTGHLESDAGSVQRLSAFVASAADAISANRGAARDVLLEFMRSDATPDGPQPYLERIHEPFVALIEAGQREGEMRRDYDAAFLAQMAVGMLNSAITSWLADPLYPVERGLVEATDFVIDALTPPAAPRGN